MVNFTRLTFDTNDHDAIRQQLTSMMSETSYQGALVIIDTTVDKSYCPDSTHYQSRFTAYGCD